MHSAVWLDTMTGEVALCGAGAPAASECSLQGKAAAGETVLYCLIQIRP